MICDANAINDVVVKYHGVPDIPVNAAGISNSNNMYQLSAKFWDETLAVNLTAPFAFGHKLNQLWRRKGVGASSILPADSHSAVFCDERTDLSKHD